MTIPWNEHGLIEGRRVILIVDGLAGTDFRVIARQGIMDHDERKWRAKIEARFWLPTEEAEALKRRMSDMWQYELLDISQGTTVRFK